MTSFHEFHEFHHIWSSETRLGILATDKPTHSPMTIRRIPWEMIDWSTKIHVRIGFLARMVSIVLLWRGCVKIRESEEGQGKKKPRNSEYVNVPNSTSRQLSNFSPWSSAHCVSSAYNWKMVQHLRCAYTQWCYLLIPRRVHQSNLLFTALHSHQTKAWQRTVNDGVDHRSWRLAFRHVGRALESRFRLFYTSYNTLSEGFGVKQKGNYCRAEWIRVWDSSSE